MPASPWAAMNRLRPFLLPYRSRFAAAFAAVALAHVVEALAPLLLKQGVETLRSGAGALAAPVGGILFLAALRYGLVSFGRGRNASVSVDLAADLRIAVFSHLQHQGEHFFSRYALGDLIARATSDIDAIRWFFRLAISHAVSIATVVVVAPIFMVSLAPALTLLVVGLLCGLVAFSVVMANAIRHKSHHAQAAYAELGEAIQRNLHGVRTIQAHGPEDREILRFSETADLYAHANVDLFRAHAFMGSFLTAGAGASALLVAGVGGAQALDGALGVGALVAFIFYSGMVLGVLGNAGMPVFAFLRAATASARLFQLLDEQPEIVDSRSPEHPKISGAIEVRNLSFRYPNGCAALNELSFTVAPGEFLAIFGRTGAGKTTLLRLLARRLDPTGGAILFDGVNSGDFPLQQLRREIVLVAQESFLFAASLRENISYDDPERGEDAIWRAAEAAALAQTIRATPQGLATPIGERGVTLSGGQKQRTALARGLIREAPVLLLDDCFSALDAETEARILRDIRRMRRGLTTVIVSHRITLAQYADKALILDEAGPEYGAPKVLRTQGGVYAEFLARQRVLEAAQDVPDGEPAS